MGALLRKVISLIMLVVVLIVAGKGHASDFDFDKRTAASHCCENPKADNGQATGDFDGCHSCANCPCHAPLAFYPSLPQYAPTIILKKPHYQQVAISDVFLPKFIPPQNLV